MILATKCRNCTEPTTDPSGTCTECAADHPVDPTCEICGSHLIDRGTCDTAGCPNDWAGR